MPLIQLLQETAVFARQATATAITASIIEPQSTGTASATPAGTGPSGTTAVSTPTNTNSSDKGGGSSSPLLFFVALGFGVVFTNLWIIVGVKYCFRYNARARQIRMANANEADVFNMEPVHHTRRRRREKKLMSIDEVNEKFPMVKYKSWVASRAKEGLPTRGGVDAPTSRPVSVRSVEAASTELAPVSDVNASHDNDTASVETKDKTFGTVTTTETNDTARPAVGASTITAAATDSDLPSPQQVANSGAARPATVASADDDAADEGASTKDALMPRVSVEQDHHSDDDGDEHINAALPPECVGTTGDTCAICIDTLEEDDDVRGLTCGHAFHAVCLDPWLTSRRACCPLCKADYYTPKPRASVPGNGSSGDGSSAAAAAGLGPSGGPGAGVAGDGFQQQQQRMNLPVQPDSTWRGQARGFGSRLFLISPPSRGDASYRPRSSPYGGDASGAGEGSGVPSVPPAQQDSAPRPSLLDRIRNAPGEFRRQRQQQQQPAAAPASDVTPSQLEAGVRP